MTPRTKAAAARRVASMLAFAAISASVATGCGGGSSHPLSKAQYERQVTKIQQQVFAKVNPATIMASARGGDPTEGLLAVQEASKREAADLAHITPPSEIAKPHRRLVTAIRSY